MALSDDDVRAVARLARLALSDDEISAYREQLSAILGYVEQLAELDLSDVDPAPYPFPMTLPVRPDEPSPTLSNEQALANAPASSEGAFVVPKILAG